MLGKFNQGTCVKKIPILFFDFIKEIALILQISNPFYQTWFTQIDFPNH